MRFIRSFQAPRAIPLSVLDEGTPEGVRELYTYLKNYRDKHISHRPRRVNQLKVGIILGDPAREERGVLGVGWLARDEAMPHDSR